MTLSTTIFQPKSMKIYTILRTIFLLKLFLNLVPSSVAILLHRCLQYPFMLFFLTDESVASTALTA